jgi:hypothetical protein
MSSTTIFRARWLAIVAFLTLLTALPFAVRAAEVTASLDENSVVAGEMVGLLVEVTDGRATNIKPPQVPGLEFSQGGTSQSYKLENGKYTSSFGINYTVSAQKPGEYTIPPFTVTVDGAEMKTQPLKLTVRGSGTQPPAGGGANAGGQDAADPSTTGFITVEPVNNGRNFVWVGELAPVKIKVWVPPGSSIRSVGKLQPGGAAFTLLNVSKAEQRNNVIRNGSQYTVLIYDATLSATKAGMHLPDLTLTATAMIRERNPVRPRNRRDPFRDPFDDPFFSGFIERPKPVELKTLAGDDFAIEVRELPAKGRPADFNGAVGRFSFEHIGLPEQWQTGEPQSITARIGGEGNFNLLAQPELEPEDNWKSYTGQSEFTASDAASFKGSQTFRFTAVPRKSGPQTVQMGFSYFDPQAGRYESVRSPAQTIQVRGADLGQETSQAAPAEATPKKPADDSGTLAPLHVGDTAVRRLLPLAFAPSFPVVLGSAGGVIVFGLLLGWIRGVRRDPERLARAQTEKAEREAMREVDFCAARGDAAGFFTAARRALQVKLSDMWNRPAQAITLADVVTRIPSDSPVVAFFREADRLTYSPSADLHGEDLTTWRMRLREALQSLKSTVEG